MNSNTLSMRLSAAVAVALTAAAAVSSQAQSATSTISWTASGSSYAYRVTLQNTGATSLNGFWYGWTTNGGNLPSTASSPANSLGWGNTVSGNSIMWVNNSYSYYGYTYYYGTSLAPGASTTFKFVSSSPPSAITAAPSGESVAYVGGIDSTEGAAGDSTTAFAPTFTPPPPALGVTVKTDGSSSGTPDSVILAWPATSPGLTLQTTTNLFAQGLWGNVSIAPVVVNGQYTVTNVMSGTQQFFRLVNP